MEKRCLTLASLNSLNLGRDLAQRCTTIMREDTKGSSLSCRKSLITPVYEHRYQSQSKNW